ncbi:MAG: glycosyltransferase [Chitinophagales bacterium]
MYTIITIQCVFILAAILQILIYLGIFSRLAFYKPTFSPSRNPSFAENNLPISVVICARNEAENLQKYLPLILQQKYPEFEVIVVNDASTDDTQTILEAFEKKYSHLKTIQTVGLKKNMAGKKFALTKGIEASKNEHLLFTDADCYPASQDWIAGMVKNFTEKRQIILGFGPYAYHQGYLNKIIQYETLMTALQYLSLSLMGMPYMGVGRNLAYHKSLFTENQGFQNHKNILSGDDDLFINEVATPQNTTIHIDPKTFCYSEPPLDWRRWFAQKRRHLSTGKHYSILHKIILGMITSSHFMFYGTLIVVLITQSLNSIIILLFTLRLISQFVVFKQVLKKLKVPLNFWHIILIDAWFIFYYGIFSPTIFSKAQVTWKK